MQEKKTNYAAIIAVTIAVLISVSAIVTAIILAPKGSHKDSKLEQAEEALERSQRNTDRRQDMAYVLSAFTDYQSNNNGNFPEEQGLHGKFLENYILKGNDNSLLTQTALCIVLLDHTYGTTTNQKTTFQKRALMKFL